MDAAPRSTHLAERIRREFGVDVDRLVPVGLGGDTGADLVRVVATDGSEYAAKTSRGPQPGLAVAALLAGRGVPGVPGPVPTRDGTLVSVAHDDGSRLSLVPWVHGRRVLDTGMAPREWVLLGELLGRLHTVPLSPSAPGPGSALASVPVEDHDPRRVVAQATGFGEVVRRAALDGPGDPVVVEVVELWDTHGPRVLAVAHRATELAASPAWTNALRVLCHGDPHHGNLLVDGSGQVHLVDWDDAVLAPREADLMFVVGGVFSHAPITDEQVRWFFQGYSPVTGTVPGDLDGDLLTYLRCVRSLVDVLDLLEHALAVGTHPVPDRQESVRYARGTLGPGGLLPLALG
ncbi:hypothetical protein ASD62_12135 [Phycicoccus sp. Root563]|uniref:phosphotransferase n=1 Tax=Phycicoccus sp. Root563 TaxID=1736562 RepID=UPI00070335C2|nr:phosphotransferase [Phycicoccus sp. Root563]KQZ89936.1 hypothetical protein ASD62_12135 [Phycicoccus sp. Root563]